MLLSVALGLGTWWYLRRQGGERTGFRSGGEKAKAANVKDLWGVRDIRRGVLVMENGRYAVICRLSAADFHLLSADEQDAVEDAAAAALLSLTFPVQVFVTSQGADTRSAAQEVYQAATTLPGELAQAALDRAAYLEAMMSDRAAAARYAYLAVSYVTDKGHEHAYGELMARVALVADALSPARVRLETLSSDAVADLLSHALNRYRTWRPSEALERGVMSYYHISERQATA
jgi:hypothetical protein